MATKGDVIEAVNDELEILKAKIGDVSNDGVLSQVGMSINDLLNQVNANPKYSKMKFEGMSRDNMVRVKDTMDSKGGDLKVRTISNIIYKQELDAIKKKENQINNMREGLRVSTKYMLVKGNANTAGAIGWEALKEFLEEAIKEHDKAEGRSEARQGDATMAE